MRTSYTLTIAALAICTPLLAGAPKQPVEETTTQNVELAPGSTIHVEHSTGELDFEAWDRPEVEITVTKSTYRKDGARELKRVQVTATKGGGDLRILTVLPSRGLLRPLRMLGDISLIYRIKVPRDAHLVIHHDSGDVRVEGVTGAIEATLHSGDIQLQLPRSAAYAIDAKCSLGGVYSDFDGDHRGEHVIGEEFTHDAAGPASRVFLRVGIGGIQILKSGVDLVQSPAAAGL